MKYSIFTKSDIGNVREVNQDNLTSRIYDTDRGQIVLAVMCDGMGGLSDGEVASQMVIEAFERWIADKIEEIVLQNNVEEYIETEWKALLRQVNGKVMEYATERGVRSGTTCTALFIMEGQYYIAQVGDSRAYEITDLSGLNQITTDQNFMEREIASGRMTYDEAVADKRSAALVQAIGITVALEPVFNCGSIRADKTFVLCSDGFYHKFAQAELFELFKPARMRDDDYSAHVVDYAIDVVKSRQETDNISAVAVRCQIQE